MQSALTWFCFLIQIESSMAGAWTQLPRIPVPPSFCEVVLAVFRGKAERGVSIRTCRAP